MKKIRDLINQINSQSFELNRLAKLETKSRNDILESQGELEERVADIETVMNASTRDFAPAPGEDGKSDISHSPTTEQDL